MRKAAIALLLAALVLATARLCTGIVYRADVPVAALVLKRSPDLALERTETAARPVERDIVLDEEEPHLFYGPLYLAVMRAVPIALIVMLAAVVVLLARGRARRRA